MTSNYAKASCHFETCRDVDRSWRSAGILAKMKMAVYIHTAQTRPGLKNRACLLTYNLRELTQNPLLGV